MWRYIFYFWCDISDACFSVEISFCFEHVGGSLHIEVQLVRACTCLKAGPCTKGTSNDEGSVARALYSRDYIKNDWQIDKTKNITIPYLHWRMVISYLEILWKTLTLSGTQCVHTCAVVKFCTTEPVEIFLECFLPNALCSVHKVQKQNQFIWDRHIGYWTKMWNQKHNEVISR